MEFIEGKIKTFLDVNLLGSNRKLLWVNPDCGLKTREWSQVPPSTRTLFSHILTLTGLKTALRAASSSIPCVLG